MPHQHKSQQILALLRDASQGLVYSSESDRPFEPFIIKAPKLNHDYTATQFAETLNPDVPIAHAEERSLENFFARHTDTSDPYDSGAQAIRPRYEALVECLLRNLDAPKVVRIGRIEVACYVAGWAPDGNVVGLRTVAIET